MGARTERAWLRDYRCERRTGNRTKPSIRPCGSGRRRHGLASCPSYRGGIPQVGIAGADRARSRCPSAVAALAAKAFSKKMRPTGVPSTGRQRGVRSEALTASAPVAGEHITDMVVFVKLDSHRSPKLHPSPRTRCGVPLPSGAAAPQGSGVPCQARGDGRNGVESGQAAFRR